MTISPELLAEYRKLRRSQVEGPQRVYHTAAHFAIHTARGLVTWNRLKGRIRALDYDHNEYPSTFDEGCKHSPLRIDVWEDDAWDWITDFDCCTDHVNPCGFNGPDRRCCYGLGRNQSSHECRHKCHAIALANRGGIHGYTSYLYDPYLGEWNEMDSCGGFIGDFAVELPYIKAELARQWTRDQAGCREDGKHANDADLSLGTSPRPYVLRERDGGNRYLSSAFEARC